MHYPSNKIEWIRNSYKSNKVTTVSLNFNWPYGKCILWGNAIFGGTVVV